MTVPTLLLLTEKSKAHNIRRIGASAVGPRPSRRPVHPRRAHRPGWTGRAHPHLQSSSGEFRHQTATLTYLEFPRRSRVLVAKLIAATPSPPPPPSPAPGSAAGASATQAPPRPRHCRSPPQPCSSRAWPLSSRSSPAGRRCVTTSLADPAYRVQPDDAGAGSQAPPGSASDNSRASAYRWSSGAPNHPQ